jgi:formate--tetrahydrofolate ligase
LLQTLENNPAFVHGGPFANIAHGCNSVFATKTALRLADYVVTEADFGADLGAEKFFNIKCRKAGLSPAAAVVVATIRALKMHGGAAKHELTSANPTAVRKGLGNLERHLRNLKKFGVPGVVAINHFTTDTDGEWQIVRDFCRAQGVAVARCTHWARGSAGIEELARMVVEVAESGRATFRPLYGDKLPLWDKVRCIAQQIYGAEDISADESVKARFTQLQRSYGHFPVCMAKTQYSPSTDDGFQTGHIVPIRELRLSAGAEFVVAIAGDVMTMPGRPKGPSGNGIRLDEGGEAQGLL